MFTMSDNKLETKRGTKRRLRSDSAPIYESPLICFKERLEEFKNFMGNLRRQKKKRLTRSTSRKLDKQNVNVSNDDSSRNSIIVINSDNEANDADKEDTSLSIIECGTNVSTPQQQILQNKRLLSLKNKSKRSSVILLDNDSPFVQSSGAFNGENIAPSQAEDDVVELWSCLGNNVVTNYKTFKDHNRNMINKRLNFVIDTKPNMKNLECLKTKDLAPASKKRRICDDSDTTVLPLSESISQMTLKHSKKSKRYESQERKQDKSWERKRDESREKKWNERQYKNNVNSDVAKLNKRNIFSKNTQHAQADRKLESISSSKQKKLREIIVDGCNVARMYTHNQEFSETGIKLVVDYFKSRGHVVKVFLPNHVRRKRFLFLEDLYKEGTVVFTPSRYINGKKITPYDDRYILEYATKCEGIVISSDQYRDLYEEKPEWRNTIVNRLLMPTFVGDYIMFPEDPLGKFGPNLETFLRH